MGTAFPESIKILEKACVARCKSLFEICTSRQNYCEGFDPGHVLWSVAFTGMENPILTTVETSMDNRESYSAFGLGEIFADKYL